jgi:PAS domain S-box-containing protein
MTRPGLVGDPARVAAFADAVIATTADAVVGQDAAGAITSWNTGAERVFGVSRADALGTSFTRFLGVRGAERWRELLGRVAAGERVELAALTLRRSDDQVVSASVRLSPLRDAAGHYAGSVVVVHDRSEELIAQQTLAAAEEQVRRGEVLASAGRFVIDGADLSAQWSEGMHRIYGVPPEEFEPTRTAHLELVHPDDRPAVAAAITEAIERGVAAEHDHRLARDPGRWVFLAVEPVVDQFGRVTGVSGFCQDVTVRKQAEAVVREALATEKTVSEELRRLDAMKDDFLATVSHELRTPLTSIGGYAALIAKTHPELDEMAGPIERNAAEMSRMVETLLDFCRLTADQVVVERHPVELSRLVDQAVLRSAGGLVVRNDVPRDLVLSSDADALRRILMHLLDNALRYAGADCSVVVSATREESGATRVGIADNGPGIPAAHLDRVFERFYQVPGATARRGTGVGLAIVREYATRLGGAVWCESTEGLGATFVLRLP